MKAPRAAGLMALAFLGSFSFSAAATVLAKGFFSYEAPAGWSVVPQADSNIEVARTGHSESDYASILVRIEKWSGPLHDFIQMRLDDFQKKQQSRILRSEPFLTAAGLDGVRVVLAGPLVAGADEAPTEKVLFFFDGGSGQKIFVEASCPQAQATRYVPQFDASMKTFSLE